MATTKEQYAHKTKAEMFDILRHEILAARLKVTLDRELGRTTSDKVRRLAGMTLPPIIREDPEHSRPDGHCCCCSKGSMRRRLCARRRKPDAMMDTTEAGLRRWALLPMMRSASSRSLPDCRAGMWVPD